MLLWSYMGDRGFRCSLNLSPKVLEDSPIYSTSQSTLFTMISVDDSTLFLDWISVFGSHQEVLDSGASLAIHLYPKLSANVFDALTETTIVWYHYIRLLLGVVTGSFCWCLFSAWISVCGSHQEVLDSGASLAIHLYPKLSANVFLVLVFCLYTSNHAPGQ